MATAYDPAKHYEIKVWDVEFRRNPARTLMARIYQPQGNGPFPVLLEGNVLRSTSVQAAC